MRNLVLFDIDEVINVFGATPKVLNRTGWKGEWRTESHYLKSLDATFKITWNEEVVEFINNLSSETCDVAWLTTWTHDESRQDKGLFDRSTTSCYIQENLAFLEGIMGFNHFPHLDSAGEPNTFYGSTSWWKSMAALHLVENGSYDSITWYDDYLNRSLRKVLEDCVSDESTRFIPKFVMPGKGFTRNQADELVEFLS